VPKERIKDLCSLCIAHQRETIVATDAAGEPLAPALLWMDSRCRTDVAEAERNIGAVRLHAVSGKPACTSPSIYKLMHLFRTRPELRDVAYVADLHSFLSRRLTGRAITSYASADPTGLLDMRKKAWSRSLTRMIGLDPHQLPELVEPGYLIGPLTERALLETGLPDHVMVYAGAGDAQLAGLGAGVIQPGKGFIELGTAISAGIVVDRYEIDNAFRTLHFAIPGRYCLETTVRGGMITLWWLIDHLLGAKTRSKTMRDLETQARRVVPGSDGLVTIPYWNGVMNPYWDDEARGAFIGLTPRHRPAHLYRSVLEGLAMEQRLHLEGVRKATGYAHQELILIGGGSRSDLWCQIFSDVLGRPLSRSRTPDAAATGAAILGAVGHGSFPSFERATEQMCKVGARFEPGANAAIYEQLYRDVYRGLYVDISGRMRELARIRMLTAEQPLDGFPAPYTE
jgi:xylulokinase